VECFPLPAILNILIAVDINLQNNEFIMYRLHQIKDEWAGQLASKEETISRRKLKGTTRKTLECMGREFQNLF
jgi:hypothetical protein